MKIFVITIAWIYWSLISTVSQQDVIRSDEEVLDVPYCDLVKEPSKYHGKLVRTSAIFWAFMDSSVLYSLGCNEKGYHMNPRLDCNTDEECLKLQEQLSLVSPGDFLRSRLNIKVVGVFSGPDNLDKRYSKDKKFRFELSIQKIEQVEAVAPDTPDPK